jgi:hypothetical protein
VLRHCVANGNLNSPHSARQVQPARCDTRHDYAVTSITINGNLSRGHNLDIVSGSSVEGTVTLIGGQTVVQGIARRDGKECPAPWCDGPRS